MFFLRVIVASLTIGDNRAELLDGSPIKDTAESLGIPFSCKEGVCGTCLVDVEEGAENLSELNDEEIAYGLSDKSKRLCCQAKIKSGEVKAISAY